MMHTLHQDYETYFGPATDRHGERLSLSLRNPSLSMTDYVRHPEFEVHGVALRWDDEPEEEAEFIRQDEIVLRYKDYDNLHGWENIHVVTHHANFEGIINHELYDVHPGRYSCTMAMGDAIFQGAVGRSLGAMMKELLGIEKLPDLPDFKGLHTKYFTEAQWRTLGIYSINDILGSSRLYHLLHKELPQEEWDLMDMTIQMFANPRLGVDLKLAREAHEEANTERRDLIKKTGQTEGEISGNISFAELLRRELGYIPTKPSPSDSSKTVSAFAKTDKEFVALKSHASERVRDLVEARQVVKSSLALTRSHRMIVTGTTGTCDLPLCYYYAKAHTMRWAGGNKMNPQNFTSGGKLRRAIVAPPGYVIVVIDSSQIECRWTALAAGQADLLQLFIDGEDPYNHMAQKVFPGGPFDKKSTERFMGKTMTLGLGYGMGAVRFHNEIVTGARGMALPIDMQFANKCVYTYRETNSKIVDFWYEVQRAMEWMATNDEGTMSLCDGVFVLDAETNRVMFPNGCYLRYPNLKLSDDGDGLTYQVRQGSNLISKRMWGGAFVENFIQAAARHTVAHQMWEIHKVYPVVLTTHDEAGFLAPEAEADEAYEFGLKVFRTRPTWAPDLPLDAEGGYDVSYSK